MTSQDKSRVRGLPTGDLTSAFMSSSMMENFWRSPTYLDITTKVEVRENLFQVFSESYIPKTFRLHFTVVSLEEVVDIIGYSVRPSN